MNNINFGNGNYPGTGQTPDCWVTAVRIAPNKNAYRLTSKSSGKQVSIPTSDDFEYFRYRINNKHDRLADAYAKREGNWKIVPEAALLPCIKKLYTGFKDAYDKKRNEIFRPFGDWVFVEACNCLQRFDVVTGRTNLGDGFTVPSETEQDCIVSKMKNEVLDLTSAMKACCDIPPYPAEQIPFITDSLNNSKYLFYDIIAIAHTDWVRLHYPTPRVKLDNGLTIPSSVEMANIEKGLIAGNDLANTYNYYGLNDILPPESLRSCIENKILAKAATWVNIFNSCQASGGEENITKNNTFLYVALGAIVLILLSRKD